MQHNPHERAELLAHLREQLHAIRAMLASPSTDLDRFVAINTSAGVLALVRARGTIRFGMLTDPGLVLLERHAIEAYRKAWNAKREVRANAKTCTVTVYRLREALELDLANVHDLLETVKDWQH
jgi:hypothetical protein